MSRTYIFIVALVCSTSAFAADDYKARFLQEAPAAWQKYVDFASPFQGRSTGHTKGDFSSINVGEIKHNGECGLLSTPWQVVAFNPSYSFELSRKTPDDAWLISRISRPQEATSEEIVKDCKRAFRHSYHALHLDHDVFGTELLKQPNFRVLRAFRADATRVRVEFENPHAVKDRPFCPIQAGVLVVAPERSWRLYGGEFQSKYDEGDKQFSFEVTYRDEASEHSILQRRVEKHQMTLNDGTISKWEVTTDFDFDIPTPLPNNDEFTLSAFGLAEPAWLEEPKATRLWLWIGLVGAVLLLLGTGIWWRRR